MLSREEIREIILNDKDSLVKIKTASEISEVRYFALIGMLKLGLDMEEIEELIKEAKEFKKENFERLIEDTINEFVKIQEKEW